MMSVGLTQETQPLIRYCPNAVEMIVQALLPADRIKVRSPVILAITVSRGVRILFADRGYKALELTIPSPCPIRELGALHRLPSSQK